jgi:acetylornithine deacetylase
LQIDLRQLPGMSIGELRAELHHRVSRALEGSGLAVQFRALFPGIPAMETAADAPIVQTVEKLTGHAAEAVAFGTEGPYLNQLGMQTVILGPGNIEQAHQPDEYLALDRIPPCLELLGQLIGKFCVKSGG